MNDFIEFLAKDDLIYSVTDKRIRQYIHSKLSITGDLKNELVFETRRAIKRFNSQYGTCYKQPDTLSNLQIAMLMKYTMPVCCIHFHKAEAAMSTDLAVYQDSGENQGLYIYYRKTPLLFEKIIMELNRDIKISGIKEVIRILKGIVPQRELCEDKNFVPVKNAVYDRSSKTFIPCSPERVFTSNFPYTYINDAGGIRVIDENGNSYNFDEWIEKIG